MFTQTRIISAIIAANDFSEKQFFEHEIARWKGSEGRKNQIIGDEYYKGMHDVLKRKRTVIGPDGRLQEAKNLPNNKIVDNQYAKMVDQKTNYLLGTPFTYQTSEKEYHAALGGIFDRKFKRTLQNIGEDSLNGGIAWLYIYCNEDGKLDFRRFAPYEVLPYWADDEHTILECLIRVYEVPAYDGPKYRPIERVEIYREDRVEYYLLLDGELKADSENPTEPYLTSTDEDGNMETHEWGKIPIVAFKYNNEETPLICKVKSLQDAINATLSDFQNNMQEDSRNTILVIKNYDGENLGEFRHNLATYGAVKVRAMEGENGGVDALQVKVNAENYRTILEILKRAMVENAMGFDAKDLRSSTPNQMNIQSMYSDVDLDANGMETELQASFEALLWFVNLYLSGAGNGNFADTTVEITFKRDIMMNEADEIDNIRNSLGFVSIETLVSRHPYVTNAEAELKKLEKERQEEIKEYRGPLPLQEDENENT